ncbi:cell envelope biogenesis protein TolA [Sphingomonas sp.]|uniref:cell envelope biogenesis protein TolA n=1 Tax=Sphingomonas sp. TaxID=28214 RepID=UPI0025DE13D1|nr:cell envelope biogenesis protein TolA [Sphingomonas sp.]
MTAIAARSYKTDRGIEFAVSGLLHLFLLAGLSLVLLVPRKPPPPPAPMDVTIADDVGLQAAAPQAVTPPAESRAPDLGAPEEAAPPAPAPEPQPVPAKPKPVEAAPAPKPAESAKPLPAKKPQPAPPQPAKPQTRTPSGALAGIVGRGSGTAPGAKAVRPRGSNLGGVMVGVGNTPTTSKSTAPQAAMTGAAIMDIRQKIAQQVQPCANRQVNPGPGANQIRVSVKLRINRDGTLAARPQIVGHDGVDDSNRRYVDQVDDRAVSTFMGCQPLRGLPPELYDVPNGWSNFVMRYKLPG